MFWFPYPNEKKKYLHPKSGELLVKFVVAVGFLVKRFMNFMKSTVGRMIAVPVFLQNFVSSALQTNVADLRFCASKVDSRRPQFFGSTTKPCFVIINSGWRL